jgi:hypothetical protein
MNIAGVARPAQVIANCSYSPSGLKCKGNKSIDMTLFDIEPPSIMFGAMTVGKDVDIQYDIQFQIK